MNLRSLQCFVALAEELNFSRAARRLNMSQPPLTQHIKRLERELNAQLFHRTKRSVRISDVGASLLDTARSLIAQAEGLPQLARRAEIEGCGYLRAGFVASAIFTEVRQMYTKLSSDMSGIVTMWHELNSAEQIEALRNEALDLAFVYLPVDCDELEVRPLVRDPLVIAVPEHHRFAKRRKVTLSALRNDRFVLPARHLSPGLYDRILSACHTAGISPTVPHQPRHMLSILSLVSMGAGVSFLPRSLAGASFPGVTFLNVSGDAPSIEIAVAWNPANRSATLSKALDRLL
jgi:DNA-binding transcriptional LysR family regulator